MLRAAAATPQSMQHMLRPMFFVFFHIIVYLRCLQMQLHICSTRIVLYFRVELSQL